MRVESHMVSLSWIPSESVSGWMRRGFDVGLVHYDEPPLDALPSLDAVQQLRADDRFRFANLLTAWAEFADDGTPTAYGYGEGSGAVMGSTTVRVASAGATFGGYALPVLQDEPVLETGLAHFTQTVGGRSGVPLPRPAARAHHVLWQAPIVWTTLALTLRSDGTTVVAMPSASCFPRHWVYGPDGVLTLKSGLTDQEGWMAHSFGARTPWGEQDSEAVLGAVEHAVERQLSEGIMRAGHVPEVRAVPAGSLVAHQGDPGGDIYLVLDGVVSVEAGDEELAEVGPGAVLGEAAVLEGGPLPASLRTLTPARLAVAHAADLDLEKLRAVAELRRDETPRPAARARR
ncbi:cyclic nucleotide-binding domain-containing protein [Georgenia sp. AZ-5]|uniref:cyclic nucleotide-binding domain-containing protein n=1 Tax=Georgenia sp. AZ-5 TaxID=3367526 RepID=UPI00375409B5